MVACWLASIQSSILWLDLTFYRTLNCTVYVYILVTHSSPTSNTWTKLSVSFPDQLIQPKPKPDILHSLMVILSLLLYQTSSCVPYRSAEAHECLL